MVCSRDIFDSLLTSGVRADLVRWCLSNPVPASVHALARQMGYAHRSVRKEAERLQEVGILEIRRKGAADWVTPSTKSPVLRALNALRAAGFTRDRRQRRHAARVRSELVALGAPLLATPAAHVRRPTEEILLDGLALARDDATLLRVLPVVVVRQESSFNWNDLFALARARRMASELGMLLDLTASISGRTTLATRARHLRDERRKGLRFFQNRSPSPRERTIAIERTPEAVRRWGFLMNMDEAAFRTTLQRHDLLRG
jgi:DNA-binding transcriptional ArsR family regulator